jgi:hypothetical protein
LIDGAVAPPSPSQGFLKRNHVLLELGSISVTLSWAIEQSQEQAACIIPVKNVVCVFRCAIPRFCNYSIATYGIFYHSIRGHEQNLVAGVTSDLVFIAAPLFSPT